jgi:RimJ/RimL family protein N-acetyltransferase
VELKLSQGVLRPWQVRDAKALVLHANNRKIWLNLRDAFPHPYTLADARQWIQFARSSKPPCHFAIVIDGKAVGGIGLMFKEDVFRKSVEIGYWLGEAYWGRGIATEAVRALTDYAFTSFDICRIFAGVYEWNPASMRVLEKAGYTLEGRLKKSVTKDGKTIDEFLYARTV